MKMSKLKYLLKYSNARFLFKPTAEFNTDSVIIKFMIAFFKYRFTNILLLTCQ